MPEYITKEQAIAVVKEAIANIVNSDSEMVCLTDLEIEIQMTITDYTDAADVAPVVHGRWRIIKEAPIACKFIPFNELTELDLQNKCRCSRCGFNCGIGVGQSYLANYCPQCGARMDGEYHG